MFWKKRRETTSEILDKLLPVLKLASNEIETIKHQIDLLNLKFKSKFFKKKEEEDLEAKTETSLKDDGFEEIRQLRQSGVH